MQPVAGRKQLCHPPCWKRRAVLVEARTKRGLDAVGEANWKWPKKSPLPFGSGLLPRILAMFPLPSSKVIPAYQRSVLTGAGKMTSDASKYP